MESLSLDGSVLAQSSPTTTATPNSEAIAPANFLENTAGLKLGEGSYKEDGRFEVGILEGYNLTSVAAVPIVESPDRSLAYSVTMQQRSSNEALSANALTQITIETFERGEGFQAAEAMAMAPGEILLPWTGLLSFGGNTQPMGGKVLTRQVDRTVLMLVVAATEAGASSVDSAIAILADSLKGQSQT